MGSTHSITASSVVVATKNQVSSQLAEETVILNLEDSVYYGLDEVGSRIWESLKQPTPVAAIRDTLCAEYEIDSNECEQDLLSLLASLADHGLIEIRNEPAG